MSSSALIPAPSDHPMTLSPARKGGLVLSCLVAGLTFPLATMFDSNRPVFIYLVGASLLASLPLALRGGLGGQVIARALWWQGALMGALASVVILGNGGDKTTVLAGFMGMALGGVGAIISAGNAGLQQRSARFAPAAFRGGLMLSMVLALADTQALLLYGALALEERGANALLHAGPFFASAGVMVLALWGLWNMKMWGFLLNIVANVVIAGLALSDVFRLPDVLAASLVATAAVQLLIPVPMIRAMIRSRRRLGV